MASPLPLEVEPAVAAEPRDRSQLRKPKGPVHRDALSRLEQRIEQAADTTLARQQFVSPIDVLIGIGWLPPSFAEQWRQGRLPCLEQGAPVNPA
jgi:hypothetical protein